jgi:protein SCO1
VINRTDRLRRIILITLLCVCGVVLSCQRTKTVTKRYPFTGRVVSIDAQDQAAIIAGDNIPGFMDAMTMSYKIKPPAMVNQLAAGDAISAEVVEVQPETQDSVPDYWLESVKVTAHAQSPEAASTAHIPAPGEDIPDFSFTNQDGRRISLHQYRGKVVLVTFIYTRCPFPDFCPRMSSNFDEIEKQLNANPALANVDLLSISFDPEHDTPKVLREYGFSVAHTHDPALFLRWEFAVPRAADLPKIADFFGLTLTPQNGVIIHNLSTAVIGRDGKIANWYHGGDWQVSDLMKDAADALARK